MLRLAQEDNYSYPFGNAVFSGTDLSLAMAHEDPDQVSWKEGSRGLVRVYGYNDADLLLRPVGEDEYLIVEAYRLSPAQRADLNRVAKEQGVEYELPEGDEDLFGRRAKKAMAIPSLEEGVILHLDFPHKFPLGHLGEIVLPPGTLLRSTGTIRGDGHLVAKIAVDLMDDAAIEYIQKINNGRDDFLPMRLHFPPQKISVYKQPPEAEEEDND